MTLECENTHIVYETDGYKLAKQDIFSGINVLLIKIPSLARNPQKRTHLADETRQDDKVSTPTAPGAL